MERDERKGAGLPSLKNSGRADFAGKLTPNSEVVSKYLAQRTDDDGTVDLALSVSHAHEKGLSN